MAGLRWRGEAPSVGSIPTISRLQNKGENVNERFNLFEGNCLEVMKTMNADLIDSIVTDPPYELGFMGKSWDSSGIAFNVEVWQEALRVLKPGGHLIAFSGSRTYHRMAVAIEDAGFEIRDQIMWVYGSGFPKSHNISKGLDKSENNEVWENNKYGGGNSKCDTCGKWMISGSPCQCPKSPIEFKTAAAKQWQGWGTALKPAHEPMVLARKPLIGTVANNVLTFGVGGLNIDGSRVGSEGGTFKASKPEGISNGIYGEGINGTVEIGQLAAGRFPANFIHDGSDEVVALFPDSKSTSGKKQPNNTNNEVYSGTWDAQPDKIGGFDDSGSAARFFYCAKASKKDRNEGLDGFEARQVFGDEGGTYQGLSNSKHPDRNHHPTVKPTTLMQYLVRLVTPPNGIVLDPFLGSGSTGKAAMYEGFNFVGIELTPEYLPIAKARILFALKDKEGELDFEPQ
jgi:site-specific DNA-methyltransferase (adenine-specific)